MGILNYLLGNTTGAGIKILLIGGLIGISIMIVGVILTRIMLAVWRPKIK